jgi:uncharacterized protein (TIGR02001 family)
MRKNFLLTTAICASFAAAVMTPTASANDVISVSASVVSDYRFRGVSQSDTGFAVQGSIEASANAFYGGIWGSTIADYGTALLPKLNNPGTNGELNFYGGYSHEVGMAQFDVGLRYYKYVGGKLGDFAEVYGSVGVDLGVVFASVGVEYAFKNDALGQSNTYLYVDAEFNPPAFPVGARAHIGYEDGAFGDKKMDWKVGLFTSIVQMVELSVDYVGTDVKTMSMHPVTARNFDNGFVFGISVSF